MKRFSDFFIEFHCLLTFLSYEEAQCMNNLQNKIASCLQAALLTQMVQSTSLTVLKDYLIHLDNEQRAVKAVKDQKDTSTSLRDADHSK